MDLLEDTIICLLCRGTVNYSVDDNHIFFRHLKLEHSVHYEQQFILAVNFFDEDSKKMVIKNFEDISEKKKENQFKETNDTAIESMDDDDQLIIDKDNDEGEMEEFKENFEPEVNKIHEYSNLNPAFPETRKAQSCPVCSYTMPSGGNLKRHMKKQHPQINPDELINSSILAQKETSILPQKETPILPQKEVPVRPENNSVDVSLPNLNDVQCYQCKAQFSTSTKLNKHKHNTRHQILPPQNEGDQIFPSPSELTVNVKKELLDVKKEIVDNSKKEDILNVKDFSNFGQHILTENKDNVQISSPESVTCNLCKKVFRTKKLLSKHHSTAHAVKPFTCDDCPKTFVDELNLRRHVFQYHPTSLKKVANTKAKAAENLHERINEVLADKKVVDKESDLNALINEVKRELKNINESTDVDTTKGKLTKESLSFQSILANAIANEPKEEANNLSKRLKEEPNPTREESKEDTNTTFKEKGEESITCNECDKTFSTHNTLKVHKVIHTGQKPFACDRCDDAFSQKSNLRRHINARHK